MNESRFRTVVLLHDHGDNHDGPVKELAHILQENHPLVKFVCPPIPTALDAQANVNLLAVKLLPVFQPNSLVVGLGLSGLFAVAIQERFPALNLSVFAINAPSSKDGLTDVWKTRETSSLERVVLYSSQYEPIRDGQPEKWSQYADQVYDVPWLSGGVQKAMYATSYLISAYMRGLDLRKEVPSILPQIKTEAAGI